MRAKTIVTNLQEGKFVVYRIRRLRGYTYGWGHLAFVPEDGRISDPVLNLGHRLKCYRFDEAPSWHVFENEEDFKKFLNQT